MSPKLMLQLTPVDRPRRKRHVRLQRQKRYWRRNVFVRLKRKRGERKKIGSVVRRRKPFVW